MNIYKLAEEKSDLLRMSIEKSNDVTVSEISSSEVVIKNNLNGKFLLLNEDESFIWSKLSEKTTIKDVAVKFFLERGKYAREYVLRVIHTFYINGFLQKQPENIYLKLTRNLEKTSKGSEIKRIASLFFNFKIEIKNIDRVLTILYKMFFRLFFNKPAFYIYSVVSILGFILLVTKIVGGKYSFFQVSGSATLGSMAAIGINLFLTSIHEAAHAFSAKYFGRRIDRGGLLLYLGLPCLYVDTNEIWLSGRKARIMVSLAGPASTVVVASISMLIMQFFPHLGVNDLLFKVAIWGFLGAIVNMNPLLELDGYYIMIDYFKKPMMRSKSFKYIKTLLSDLIRLKDVKKLEWDKIVYGVMAILWSILSVFIVLWIIEYRGERILKDLVGQSSFFIKLAGVIILLFWMVPVVISMLLFVFLKLKQLYYYVIASSAIKDPKYSNVAMGVVLLLALLIPYSLSTNVMLLGVSLAYLANRNSHLLGSQITLIVKSCYLMVFLDLLCDLFFQEHAVYIGLGFFMITAAIAAYVYMNFVRRSFVVFLGLLSVSMLLNIPVFRQVAPLICMALIVNLESEIVYFRKLFLSGLSQKTEASDLGKLKVICSKTSKVIFSILSKYHSRQKLDRIIKHAHKRGFEFENGFFVTTDEISGDIIRLSQEGRDLVSYLLVTVKKFFGEKYTNMLLTSIFDNLFWSEKEIFDKYIIPEKDLMDIATLSSVSFDKLDFLHSVTLFSSFEKDELVSLSDSLQIIKVKSGENIITEGSDGDALYIILEGEVEILSQGRHIATLFAKDFFGEVAIIKKCPRTADAKATNDCALLVLSKEVFGSFVETHPTVFQKMDQSVRVLGFLKSMPFFKNLADPILSTIATKSEVVDLSSQKAILKEGESSSDFYIIRDGKCSVTKDGKNLTTLVRGEFFGEMLILDDDGKRKATASISTVENCTFYKLKREVFREIVDNHAMLRREFKVISSRRVLENRYNRMG